MRVPWDVLKLLDLARGLELELSMELPAPAGGISPDGGAPDDPSTHDVLAATIRRQVEH